MDIDSLIRFAFYGLRVTVNTFGWQSRCEVSGGSETTTLRRTRPRIKYWNRWVWVREECVVVLSYTTLGEHNIDKRMLPCRWLYIRLWAQCRAGWVERSALVIGSLLKSSRSNPLLLLLRHPAECVLVRVGCVRASWFSWPAIECSSSLRLLLNPSTPLPVYFAVWEIFRK